MTEIINLIPWWAFAILFTFLWPIQNEANRYFQVEGTVLLIWRSFFGTLILLPVACFAPWPDDPIFYGCVILSGLLFSYNEAEAYKLAKEYGGLFLSLQAVIWILTATILWWLIDSSSFYLLLNNPVAGGLVLMGLILGIGGQMFSWRAEHIEYNQALKKLVIIAVMGGAAVTSMKFGMDHTDSILSVFVWSFSLSIAICVSGLARLFLTGEIKRVEFFDLKTIRAGFVLSLLVAVAGPIIAFAFAKAPNPGFANIVTRLSTVWLYIYCFLFHKPIHVKTASLILILFGSILLILGTHMFGF